MILQALKEYYDRKAEEPQSEIPKFGWDLEKIPFIIVISEDGTRAVNIEDTRESGDDKKTAHKFYVPKGVRRTSGIASNFLWDKLEYALGCQAEKKGGKPEEIHKKHECFKARLAEAEPSSKTAALVLKFLNRGNVEAQLEGFEAWRELKKDGSHLISFRIDGGKASVFEEEDVKKYVNDSLAGTENGETIRCLITGEKDVLAKRHPLIEEMRGVKKTGGTLVAFNLSSSKFFNKKQGENAPIGERAAFAYTTALNWLLRKDSHQKVTLGDDVTVVFWAARQSVFENSFAWFFGGQTADDPDACTRAVEALYKSVPSGSFVTDGDNTRFYALGLSPNAARISVRFWQVGTVAELAERFRTYFDELLICHDDEFKDHLPLNRLLLAVGARHDGRKEIEPPTLAGDVMRAVLSGAPFPETLLATAVRRIKAEPKEVVTYELAKLIKGCINRKYRMLNYNNERMLEVSLDKQNTNAGYLCGRLFAVLEKIQKDVTPGVNSTIGERYYNAASSSPTTAFPLLMRLKNHHLSKMDDGRKVFYDKLLQEIINGLPGGLSFPAHLSLVDQGNFAIGYYHQKNSLDTKGGKSEENDQTE